MTIRAAHLVVAGLMALLFLGVPVPASPFGEGLKGPDPVELEAEELVFDQVEQTYRARGAVRLQRGAFTLLADRVLYNFADDTAAAEGEVRLIDPEGTVDATRLEIDLESGLGLLTDARIVLHDQDYRIRGRTIRRLGEQDYRIERGTFTTCDGEVPDWKFGARRLDVTVGGYARARHAFFYIRDIPVLYAPYFFYPVKTERESGFLIPRIGVSSRRGFQFTLPWYQVIDRNQDATFYLDYLSKLGLGKGLEYRYIFGTEDAGELNLYHLTGFSGDDDRQAVDWRHMGTLPGGLGITADVEWVSRRDYYREFGETAGEYNREEVTSVIALNRRWTDYNLTGQVRYVKDLLGDNDETLQRLPEAVLHAVRRPLGKTPFFLAMDASVTNFHRREGVTGRRLNVRPELSAAFHPGDLLEIRPSVGYRERLYSTSGDGDGFEREGIVDVAARVSTRFARTFDVNGRRVSRIRHLVQPEILYTFVPDKEQQHLPQFDLFDTIEAENRFSYALVNRLTARLESATGEPLYHEFLYLRLSQSYDIEESRRDRLLAAEQRTPFSDLRAELLVRPNRWSFLELDTRVDVGSEPPTFLDRFFLFNLRGGVRDESGNALALDYRYLRDFQSHLTGEVSLAWLRPFYLGYLHRHDLEAGRSLEKVFSVEYRSQCWSLFLTFRDRLEDTEYLVTFALTGLGKVADLGGSLGRRGE